MRSICIGAMGVLLMMAGTLHGEQDRSTVSAAPGDAVHPNARAKDVSPELNDVLAAFHSPSDPDPEVDARMKLDDLIEHFKGSTLTNNFINHPLSATLRASHITEQAHSTVGRYSFTINRLADRDAAQKSLDEIFAYGHQGAMNGVFTICIHKGYEAAPVLAVFRAFSAPKHPAGAVLGQELSMGMRVEKRVANRTFPSVFQAWNPADNLKEDALVTAARHDLLFHGAGFFGLQWNDPNEGLATGFTPQSVQRALLRRRDLLSRNPQLVLLMEIRYRDAHRTYLPEGHPWWRRDKAGNLAMGWAEGGYIQLDFSKPEYRNQVAIQAKAAVDSGVVDGIMLDWWQDDDARLALIQSVREHIGEDALILVNANDRTTPRTAPFINGYFMECYRSRTVKDWGRIASTLEWAEKNLRAPRINCLETWYHQSRHDENLMRATTTLSLTLSDGYCLFSDPNPLPTPDHLHNWYPFWEKQLGKPVSSGKRQKDGTVVREFGAGTAVYNPMGNGVVEVEFDAPRTSAATGKTARRHVVADSDGDLFLVHVAFPSP